MYSLVLMSAMSSAPDAPQFNGYFRDLFGGCHGCNGCNGARYDTYVGCCGGCCGGHALFGLRDRSWFFNGCCGGCCGGYGGTYAYGCSGSPSYSCYGGPVMAYNPQFSAGLSCTGGGVPFAPPPDFGPIVPSVPAPGPGIPYATPDPAPPGVIPD